MAMHPPESGVSRSAFGAGGGSMAFSEIIRLAVDTFRASKVRFLLTMLGMVIGSASIILVVTLGDTGKSYALDTISGLGPNKVLSVPDAVGIAIERYMHEKQGIQQELLPGSVTPPAAAPVAAQPLAYHTPGGEQMVFGDGDGEAA